MPTGATVAAPTTSLPETPGGERNWDYRYTWMRDTTFTLQALHFLDLDWEADEFMQFVADLEPNEDGGLQIMYGIDGRRDLTESTRDDLSGYEGARPVRIGNGALRSAPERRVRRGSRLAAAAHASQQAPAPPAVAAGAVAGRVRARGVARAGPGDLGGPWGTPALRVVEADVLGRPGPGLEARGDPRRPRAREDVGRRRRGDPRGHPGARCRRPRCPPAALRHRRAGRLDPARRDLRVPAGRRRAVEEHRRGDLVRADRERLRAALRHRRDRRRPLRQGRHVPDLLLLARLRARHRRRDGRRRPT